MGGDSCIVWCNSRKRESGDTEAVTAETDRSRMEKHTAALGSGTLPPSYDETVQGSRQGPAQVPGAWATLPPPQYSEAPQQQVRVVYLPAPDFGPNPVKTICPSCQASITSTTSSRASLMAWGLSAILCFTMLWPCFCLPFCVDSLQDVKHTCPNCKHTIGRYRGE